VVGIDRIERLGKEVKKQLMLRESGCKSSPIWLIGDSSPPKWRDFLAEPLDSKHPARHNIWTPIVEGIQKEAFFGDRRRVDVSQLYIRNAVHNQEDKPLGNAVEWSAKLLEETNEFGELLEIHAPTLVFTFGAFAFEFARRSLVREPRRNFGYWTTKRLGEEFGLSVKGFNHREVNVFCLLHVSIARGKFLESHKNFTREDDGNYFDLVAREIGTLLLKHKDTLNIWVD
jgi:hypothetical protein